jgi:hypothetical protein
MRKPILIILGLFVIYAPLSATTYFMRGDGTAANKAAATSCSAASTAMNIATHNSQTFSPGDIITMCDTGGVFLDNVMVIPSSGTSGNPITYTNSGTPVVDGSDIITTWTVNSGNVWQATIPARNLNWVFAMGMVMAVYRDGLWLGPHQGALGQLIADGQWFWDGATTIYVYSIVNPNSHLMQVGNRDVCIFSNNNSYLTFQNLTLQHANEGWGLEVSGINNSIAGTVVTNLTSIRNGNGAFETRVGSGFTNTGITLSGITDTHSGVVNQSNTAGDIDIGFPSTGTVSNVTITNSKLSFFGVNDTSGPTTNNQAGIVLAAVTTGTVTQNQVDDSALAGVVLEAGTTGVTVSYNKIFSNGSASDATAGYNEGIYVSSASSSNTILYNLSYLNFGAGVSFQSGTGLLIYGNTIYGNGNGILLGVSGATVNNNITAQNTSLEISTLAAVTLTSDYNDFYHAAGGNFMSYQGTAGTFAQWKTASSQDSHSISVDPTFTNASGNVFTVNVGSPTIGGGLTLGGTYQNALSSNSTWPSGIVLVSQPALWNLGAFTNSSSIYVSPGSFLTTGMELQ